LPSTTSQGGCQFVAGDPATPWAVLLGLCVSLAWRGRRDR
jgi:MYXO-CTERM domain-containing protein